jgi:hypothetical protein
MVSTSPPSTNIYFTESRCGDRGLCKESWSFWFISRCMVELQEYDQARKISSSILAM